MSQHDALVFVPADVDLTRSPLAGAFADAVAPETYVLGAFNPGLTRLASGNLLMMVRVAEALRQPVLDGAVRAIRWVEGRYRVDRWPLDRVELGHDPRTFTVRGAAWRVLGLTSLSWLLPVELSSDATRVIAVHYERAVAPTFDFQCYGIEDARISRVEERWLMTTCSVSPERHSTTLYTSTDGLDWDFADIVLDHQNKDMLIFEGRVNDQYWAQTRPLGDLYFAYPPDSPWAAGPAINLATSPDALHWKPHRAPGIRPTAALTRIGGGAPPVRTPDGWLSLWHGVQPGGQGDTAGIGVYRTYWSILDAADPSRVVRSGAAPLLEANPALTAPLADAMYLHDVVFTTGIVDAGDAWLVASGECDLACRITRVEKRVFG